MTDNEIDNLTGPELSAAVAREVMGWTFGVSRWSDGTHKNQWNPHADRNDAYRVLVRCQELGIEREAEYQVAMVIPEMLPIRKHNWFLLTIDPSIICRAALRAVREAKT